MLSNLVTRGTSDPSSNASLVILGADAVLAALPATPVQLAHACSALGYQTVFPASWGDELVAQAAAQSSAERGAEPAILCVCPLVTERLTRSGPELARWMVGTVAPPVAVARYLREAYSPRSVHITYVGSCPGAVDSAIDRQLSPEQLFAALAEQGIVPEEQPEFFESVLPPDRRRHFSQPGGAPDPRWLESRAGGRTFRALEGEDALLTLAQSLLSRENTLLDLAPHVGCRCSGADGVSGVRSSRARDAVVMLEPPRAPASVLDPAIRVAVDADLSLPIARQRQPLAYESLEIWEDETTNGEAIGEGWPEANDRPADASQAAPYEGLPVAERVTMIESERTSLIETIGSPLPDLSFLAEAFETAIEVSPLAAAPPPAEEPPIPGPPLPPEATGDDALERPRKPRLVLRRGLGVPVVRRSDGRSTPRAFAAARRLARPLASREESFRRRVALLDRERRIERLVDPADRMAAPAPPAHSGMRPLSPEPPGPIPPPPSPGRHRPGSLLGVVAVLGLALAPQRAACFRELFWHGQAPISAAILATRQTPTPSWRSEAGTPSAR